MDRHTERMRVSPLSDKILYRNFQPVFFNYQYQIKMAIWLFFMNNY
jgi:hypothetical protein